MSFYETPAASIMINDHIWVASTLQLEKVNGLVVEITENSIIFRSNRPLQYCKDSRYKIHFVRNRLTVRLEQKAVERVKGFNLTPLLFPVAPKWKYTAQNKR